MKQIDHHAHTYGMRFSLAHDPDYDVFSFIGEMADHGFSGVNLSANGADYRHLGGSSEERLAAIHEACAERGLTMELETSGTEIEHLHELIHAAAAIGADGLRTYTRYDGSTDDIALRTVFDLIRAAPMAADHGVTVLVENHEDFDGATLARIMESVDHPSIGLLYDYGNSQMLGEDPLECLEVMGPWVKSAHVKDHVITSSASGGLIVQGVPIGTGNLPVAEITDRLWDLGNRRFCFESVWGYNSPVRVSKLPDSPCFAIEEDRRVTADDMDPCDAIAGERDTFADGLEAWSAILETSGYVWSAADV